MTVDRPRDLEPCPERPEHHFLWYSHDRRHTIKHAHTHACAHKHEHPLGCWQREPPGHRDRCVLAHTVGWSSVNYTAATRAPSVSKTNKPTYMPGNYSSLEFKTGEVAVVWGQFPCSVPNFPLLQQYP